MRAFDSLEQEIIRKICERTGFSRNITNLLSDEPAFNGLRYIAPYGSTSIGQVKYEKRNHFSEAENTEAAILASEQARQILIQYTILLEYLENSGLVKIFEPASPSDPINFTIGNGATNVDSVDISAPDKALNRALAKFANKEIIPTAELREINRNGFRTSEEVRFRKQQVATWAAISISFLLGVATLWMGIESNRETEESESKVSVTINESAEKLERQLETLNQRITVSNSEISRLSSEVREISADTAKLSTAEISEAIKNMKIEINSVETDVIQQTSP